MTTPPTRRRRGPRPGALVIVLAAVALVVGVSGTAVASGKVRTRDLVDGAVTSWKIANGTIRSIDIKDGSIERRDLARSARTGATGPKGATGARGPAGPAGEDGQDGSSGRWALVDATGAIVAQSGGFRVASAYDNTPGTPTGAIGNVYIDANEDLSDNAVTTTIALQNQVEQDANGNVNGRAPGADSNAEFSGEITATVCGITGVVGCAPTGTNTREHFVVSPRLSDGSFTQAGNRKRFYVVITGDSSDTTADAAGIPAVALP